MLRSCATKSYRSNTLDPVGQADGITGYPAVWTTAATEAQLEGDGLVRSIQTELRAGRAFCMIRLLHCRRLNELPEIPPPVSAADQSAGTGN